MVKKVNARKFPDKQNKAIVPPLLETAEEAVLVAKAEAASKGAPGSSINISYRDGYVNGDGEVFVAGGITAGKPGHPSNPASSGT